MHEESFESKEPMMVLRSFPLDESGDDFEKVEALWRQLMVYKAMTDSDLAEAKARRAQAEAARELAERETFQATQLMCERMKQEAERDLHEAREAKIEALRTQQEAEAELARAKEERAKAERYRDEIIAEARKQAQEIIEQAKATAHHEVTEMRRQALKEVRTVMAQVENMRAAASEELETQRILANVAKLKATSRWLMTEEGAPAEAQPEPAASAAYTSHSTRGGRSASSHNGPAAEPPAPKETKASSKASSHS